MNQPSMHALIAELSALRAGTKSIGDFRKNLSSAVDQVQDLLSPGVRLKLKRGTMSEVFRASTEFVPGCARCNSLPLGRVFGSTIEHSECSKAVQMALESGTLARVSRPIWAEPDSRQLGSDGYFSCTSCGSIWTLVEPERHTYGLWQRIA